VPRTVLLIDGNSLTYRAFFALPTDLATASGQVTNAVFGFTSMLANILKDTKPDSIAVAFDLPEPTFRHERVTTYKGTRDSAPDILRQQMGLVRQVLETLRIPMLEAKGYEADDVIATLATQGRDAGDTVLVLTGDRDAYQLVEDPSVRTTTRPASRSAPASPPRCTRSTPRSAVTRPTTSRASPGSARRRPPS
jgi:DNA polymerase I